MKKLLFSFLLILLCFSSKAQYVNIPDPAFVTFLQTNYPTCMSGSMMDTTCSAIVNDTLLDISVRGISDLTGIKYFRKLKELNLHENNITSLSLLSDSIEYLDCGYNQLTNISAFPSNLKELHCDANFLTSLPSFPSSLKIIICQGNLLSSLPILPNVAGLAVDCGYNQLTALPLLPNGLTQLYCGNNLLTTLPVLPNSLQGLSCNQNQLTGLPILPTSLTNLSCNDNFLTSLPALPSALYSLHCQNNSLTGLPPFPSTLQSLYCQNNLLTALPVLSPNMDYLDCNSNQISSLPTLPSGMLTLFCQNNLLNSLPSLPSTLYEFNCENNSISCLPVLPFGLDTLLISGNPITCLPNYIFGMDSISTGLPLCISGDLINNPNGCQGASGILGYIYRDNDANCSIGAGDLGLMNIPVKIYDGSNNFIGMTYSSANGVFNFPDTIGTYIVKIDTAGAPYTVNCGQGLDTTITLSLANPLASNIDYSIICKPGFDVGTQYVFPMGNMFPGLQHQVTVSAGDLSGWNYGLNCISGLAGQVQITVNGPVTFVSAMAGSPVPTSVVGNVFTYTISDFGSGASMQHFGLYFITDTTAAIGDSICVNAIVTPTSGDNNIANNNYNFCYIVGNSYDPNFKEVYPSNVAPGYNDYFTYTIHFQNTGTDTAMNIRLTDTLDNNLDLETFQVINYSHYNTTSLNGNAITFHFPNIMLPDSTSDLDGSQGYVQYRIKPKTGLIAGTQIHNTGYIYFDYNPPIITNTTTNLFVGTSSIKENKLEELVNIFPNPSNGIFNIKLSEKVNISGLSVEVYNMLGELILNLKTQNNLTQIDLSHQPKGVYTIRLSGQNQSFSKRIIKQ